MITSSARLARHPAVAAAVVGAEAVVVAPVGTVHVLEPIAALLWQCLDGVSPLDEIADDFAAEFGVAADEVLGQLSGLGVRWHEAGLVTLDDEGIESRPGESEWLRLPPPPDP